MVIHKLLTPYNYTKGDISRIKYIVIHYVGATGGAEANCKWYAEANRGASAHYYVDFDGSIWQSVEDKNIAWSVGGKKYPNTKGGTYYGLCNNANSLNIEMCVRNKGDKGSESKDWYFEDATVNATIELTKELMKKYNIPADNVIRHYDRTGKICPNPYVYNHTKHTWADFKAAIASSSPSSISSDNLITYPIKTGQKRLTVRVDGYLNVRNFPSTGDVTTKLYNGDIVTPEKKTFIDGKAWFWIKECNGWCSASYLSGWIEESDGRWWYLDYGYQWKTGINEIDGSWYYFDKDGWLVTDDRIDIDNNTYFTRTDGSFFTNTWVDRDSKWYYVGNDGKVYKKRFFYDLEKEELYYLTDDGTMFEGELILHTNGKGALG